MPRNPRGAKPKPPGQYWTKSRTGADSDVTPSDGIGIVYVRRASLSAISMPPEVAEEGLLLRECPFLEKHPEVRHLALDLPSGGQLDLETYDLV